MRSTEETTREKKTSPGALSEKSRESVGKLLTRPNKHRSRGTKNNDNNMQQYDLSSEVGNGSKVNGIQDVDLRVKSVTLEAGGCSTDAARDTLREEKVDGGTLQDPLSDSKEEMNDSDWEDGSIPNSDFTGNQEVTIEFDETPDSVKRKPVRRATAEDKELAEIVHKVHLLCLLGRGRLIDRACDDPLTQAALLSLLPRHLLNISQITKLTAKNLHPLIHWFQDNFHVRSSTDEKRSIHSTLAFALETREGTSEEIAALSVALFRALGLTTRFVSILDVASLKPDGDKSDYFSQDAGGSIFCTSTPMVAKKNETSSSPSKSFSPNEKDSACETSHRSSCKRSNAESKDSASANESSNKQPCPLVFELKHDSSGACHTQISQGPKRKGDIEFSLQMEMAISATAAGIANIADGKMGSSMGNPNSNLPNFISPFKRMKKVVSEGSSSSHGISTAIGSRRVGSPLYWAEVYCSGENLTGKWVHVDAVNAIIDEEEKVEALAAACKRSLRYVVAFAGNGAKDVTRRYCMKWYKIASKRVNSFWWDSVLAPLKEIESRATNGMFHLENDNIDGSFKHDNPKNIAENLKAENFPNNATLLGSSGLEVSKVCGVKTDMGSSLTASRSSLEDMELETRALTEPLPTNQQAYRTHQLYAIEKWLTKYQILHPRGPILGFCAGHAVYPRTCVQTLKTKERWLRDGLQVKASELPVKELKRSGKLQKLKSFEDDESVGDNSEGTLKLYGKWQLEPLQLPHAVNGIVPKNERGQVDVWSEKCLPPGTVHLRLPRVFSVAKRLEIDYAPAMVGFEYKNGQSYPVFEGIVVCAEFKDVILEAYREEQERREAEEKKRNEMQAISRWYQLLSSIVTQQRLKNRYGKGMLSHSSSDEPTVDNYLSLQVSGSQDDKQSLEFQKGNKHKNKPNPPARSPSAELEEDHKHLFLTEDQSFDDESLILTKRCHCGFSVQVEEL